MGSQLSRQQDEVHPRDKGMAGLTDKRCENLVIRKDNRTLYGVLLSFKRLVGLAVVFVWKRARLSLAHAPHLRFRRRVPQQLRCRFTLFGD